MMNKTVAPIDCRIRLFLCALIVSWPKAIAIFPKILFSNADNAVKYSLHCMAKYIAQPIPPTSAAIFKIEFVGIKTPINDD